MNPLKFHKWVTIIALFFIFFIYNDAYLGKLLLHALFSLGVEWITSFLEEKGESIIEYFIDSALGQ